MSAEDITQRVNVNGYCPHCGADLDGDLVINYPLSQGETREGALDYARHYAGWEEHGEANRWSRKISIYCQDRDRTIEYRCPDCHKSWNR